MCLSVTLWLVLHGKLFRTRKTGIKYTNHFNSHSFCLFKEKRTHCCSPIRESAYDTIASLPFLILPFIDIDVGLIHLVLRGDWKVKKSHFTCLRVGLNFTKLSLFLASDCFSVGRNACEYGKTQARRGRLWWKSPKESVWHKHLLPCTLTADGGNLSPTYIYNSFSKPFPFFSLLSSPQWMLQLFNLCQFDSIRLGYFSVFFLSHRSLY